VATFEWTTKLSIGVPQIDADHQAIVRLLNRMGHLPEEPQREAEFRELFSEVVEMLAAHFKFEEEYFSKPEYKGADAHKREHSKLLQELDATARSDESQHPKATRLAKYLQAWQMTHIMVSDRAFSDAFRIDPRAAR